MGRIILPIRPLGQGHILARVPHGEGVGHRPAGPQQGRAPDGAADQLLHDPGFRHIPFGPHVIVGQMGLIEADAVLRGQIADGADVILPVRPPQGGFRVHGHAEIDVQHPVSGLRAGFDAEFHRQPFTAPLERADIGGSGYFHAPPQGLARRYCSSMPFRSSPRISTVSSTERSLSSMSEISFMMA